MTTDSHACTLDRPYPGSVMACACGRFWIQPPRELLRFAFINPELRSRLRDYQRQVTWGDAGSIADAVAAATLREREQRELDRMRLAQAWPRRQAAKHAKWRRMVRPIILSRPCAYCGAAAAEVDHIVPLTRGGADTMSNLAAACKSCNSEKGKRTPAEWRAWRLRRGRPWPPAAMAA